MNPPDPADSWARVELYRWQHGHLPGQEGEEEKPLDEPAALIAMADALEEGCRAGGSPRMPSPYNICEVLRYVAKKLENKQAAGIKPKPPANWRKR